MLITTTTTTISYPEMIKEIVTDKWINRFYSLSMNSIPCILSHLKDIPRDKNGLISTSHKQLLNQRISELIVMDGVDPKIMNEEFFYLINQENSKNITREIRDVLPLLWDDMKDAMDICRIMSLIVDRTRTKTIQSYTAFNTIYKYIWGPIDKTISIIEERLDKTIGIGCRPMDYIEIYSMSMIVEGHVLDYLFKKNKLMINKKHYYYQDSLNNENEPDYLKKLILLSYLLN